MWLRLLLIIDDGPHNIFFSSLGTEFSSDHDCWKRIDDDIKRLKDVRYV